MGKSPERDRHGLVAGVLAALMAVLIACAAAPGARAESIGPIDFESYGTGNINGQNGWSKTGGYDSEVAEVAGFPDASSYGFDSKALRISNKLMSGSFGDQTISPQLTTAAGESLANRHFEASFSIGTTKETEQEGLSLSVSPDDGQGSRMSYLSFVDQPDGVHVTFYDVADPGPLGTVAEFEPTELPTLNRTEAHTVRFSMDLVPGAGNDVVRIFIDGVLLHTGTSWEDYYRFDPEQAGNGNVVPGTSGLIFRTGGSGENPAVDGQGYLIDGVAFASSARSPETVTVNDDLVGPGPSGSNCAEPDFETVQDAASAVASGSTILVCAGTYTEQVDIDKSLTVLGNSAADTTIKAPATLVTKFTSSNSNKPVVYVHNDATVSLRNVTVDGDGKGNGNYRLDGIAFHNADGALRNSAVLHVRDTPLSGNQAGVGLLVINDDAASRDLLVRGNQFADFQKNAIAITGAGLSADVSNNTITAAGFTNLIAQNGVQLGEGAGGSISGNEISDIGYSPNSWCAGGILLLEAAAGVTVSGNTLDNIQCGIYGQESNAAEITGNTLLGNRYAVTLFDNPATVDGNTIDATGAGFPDSEAIFAAEYTADKGFLVKADHNTLLGNTEAALALADFDSDAFSARMEAHFNRIAGNAIGALDEAAGSLEAQNNWWGCNDGPGEPGCDPIEEDVEGTIDASPWLVLRLGASPSTVYKEVGQSQLTADLAHNSNGGVAGSGFPDGTEIGFGATGGTVWPASDATVDGLARSLFGAGGALATADTTATLDNETVHAPVEIVEPPEGPEGPQGETGPEGPQGETGPEGPQGETGPEGPQGETGPEGPQGETGPEGPQGETGPEGPQGETGPEGPQGETGPEGPEGKQGHEGEHGKDGSDGKEGPRGKSGKGRSLALQRKMTVSFPRPVAAVRKGKARVKVRCSGTLSNRCIGTLVLRAGGTASKSVYSIQRGHKAVVRISLTGKLRTKFLAAKDEGGAMQARLFARTAQTSGSPQVTSRLIRLK